MRMMKKKTRTLKICKSARISNETLWSVRTSFGPIISKKIYFYGLKGIFENGTSRHMLSQLR